jgi:hypothetical protein
MRAYALVQGPRRKVLYVSDSVPLLYTLGAETFAPSASVRFARNERAVCKEHDAYVVRIDFALGDPITTKKTKRATPADAASEADKRADRAQWRDAERYRYAVANAMIGAKEEAEIDAAIQQEVKNNG